VVTARPSYARIRTALAAIRDHPRLELQLVVAASALLDRYGNAVQVIEKEGFNVSRAVYMVLEGENLVTSAKSTGFGMAELATVFNDLKPDAVVTIADRYETIATSVAAAYMNIPLVHVQGGEVTGSIDEKTRHANTKLADLHLVASEAARLRVLKLGEDPGAIHVTGCPSIDLAREVLEEGAADLSALADRHSGVGETVDLSKPFIVVMQHPVTTEYAEAQRQMQQTLEAVSRFGKQALWFWPNVDAGSDGASKAIRMFRERNDAAPIHFYKNMNPKDFLRLLIGSRGIVGNSSVAIRECSYLGVPAVNIGSRQSRRDRGHNVTDVGHDADAILAALTTMWEGDKKPRDTLYGDGAAGRKIAEVLATAPLTIEKSLTY
jgi:UDP-hydrolysing UDP-N-acetyl-D-glucosamine 2-epimerase